MRLHARAALVALVTTGCARSSLPPRTPPAPYVDADAPADLRPVEPAPDDAADAAERVDLLLRGARLPGGAPVDVEVRAGRILAVFPSGSESTRRATTTVDVTGRWLAPGFIDSHVHLTYWPVADELVRGGVVAAVDLAAPEPALALPVMPLRLIGSGPMITAPGGYPLDSWGRDGYGVACETEAEAVAAVDRLVSEGAALIKIPLGQGPPLSDAVLRAAIARAHERGRKVAVHALSDASAALGARVGADVLAHTPVEPLAPATIAAWSGRTVISTLAAFGGLESTVANLRALRAAGVTVVYGTDLGNTRDARIDPKELALLQSAGLDAAAILEAGTSAPARLWGWSDLGSIEPGKAASLLVLAADPMQDPSTLAAPVQVIVDGRAVK